MDPFTQWLTEAVRQSNAKLERFKAEDAEMHRQCAAARENLKKARDHAVAEAAKLGIRI